MAETVRNCQILQTGTEGLNTFCHFFLPSKINQRIHDIAEARWKMLPIAVQREHDTLAMDIAELQWHLKQETAELRKAQNKVNL